MRLQELLEHGLITPTVHFGNQTGELALLALEARLKKKFCLCSESLLQYYRA